MKMREPVTRRARRAGTVIACTAMVLATGPTAFADDPISAEAGAFGGGASTVILQDGTCLCAEAIAGADAAFAQLIVGGACCHTPPPDPPTPPQPPPARPPVPAPAPAPEPAEPPAPPPPPAAPPTRTPERPPTPAPVPEALPTPVHHGPQLKRPDGGLSLTGRMLLVVAPTVLAAAALRPRSRSGSHSA